MTNELHVTSQTIDELYKGYDVKQETVADLTILLVRNGKLFWPILYALVCQVICACNEAK